MASALKRRTLVGAGLALVLLAATSALAWRSTAVLIDANAWVNRTRDVLARIDTARALTFRVEEEATRGETGRTAAFEAQARSLLTSAEAIWQLTAGNPEEKQPASLVVEDIQRLIGPPSTADVRAAANQMRDHLDALGELENRLLLQRLQTSQASAVRAVTALAVLTFWGGSLLAIAFWVIYRQTQRELRLERARRDSEQRMRIVIDKMLAGLVTTDMRGRIETVNPSAERMFGYAEGELIGASIKQLMAMSGEAAGEILKEMPGPVLGKVTEWEARRKDGSVFPMELSLFAFDADGGHHLAGFVRDISERREVDRMKTEFVSVVSHELRTPLTSIRGALQLVLDDPPAFRDPEHAPLLDIALKNSERLGRLINDILDISRIEAGQMRLQARACHVGEVIRASIKSAAEMTRTASARFIMDSEGRLMVQADADRLAQVLTNLLSNAVKFSPEDSLIHVRSRADNERVEISVQDHGQGMTVEELPQLFSKFHQLDSSATRAHGGAGLGLVIAKALVEQHGGAMAVSSEPGQGSTFIVSLPVAAGSGDQVPAETDGTPAGSRGVIIVAEDDDDLRWVLSRMLLHRGFRVIAAANGEAARSLYDTMPCDALLVDLYMPVVDGFGLIEHVRRTASDREIPILVFSGSTTGTGEARALALGANVFMTKPVSANVLTGELSRLLAGVTPRR